MDRLGVTAIKREGEEAVRGATAPKNSHAG